MQFLFKKKANWPIVKIKTFLDFVVMTNSEKEFFFCMASDNLFMKFAEAIKFMSCDLQVSQRNISTAFSHHFDNKKMYTSIVTYFLYFIHSLVDNSSTDIVKNMKSMTHWKYFYIKKEQSNLETLAIHIFLDSKYSRSNW